MTIRNEWGIKKIKEIPAEKRERETGMQRSKNTVIVKKKTLVETYFTYYKWRKQLTEVYIFHVYTSIHVNIYIKKKSQQKTCIVYGIQ